MAPGLAGFRGKGERDYKKIKRQTEMSLNGEMSVNGLNGLNGGMGQCQGHARGRVDVPPVDTKAEGKTYVKPPLSHTIAVFRLGGGQRVTVTRLVSEHPHLPGIYVVRSTTYCQT